MSKDRNEATTSNSRRRDAAGQIRSRRGDTLGLMAFEKISAVEGIHLTGEMRHEILTASDTRLGPVERTGLTTGRFSKK